MSVRVALLGAECTGKSSLTRAIGDALGERGAAPVYEYLREWCVQTGRTPLQHEQADIAAEQTRRIEAAAARRPLVVADTTALLTAVYSIHYFQDSSALPAALAAQRRFDLTLLCSPEGIPWEADSHLRESPSVRAATHAELLDLLTAHELPFVLLEGGLPRRLEQALGCIRALMPSPHTLEAPANR